ncbi:MAG TPA: GNAT family N-acetyltransferase [Trebonia sp.]|jgi:GNAT superfamily N-acetyltransferase|nr:GNAT family N-acetyltransferase [Trebonia sp.]
MADATPGDVDAIVALYAELDEFYGAAGAHDALAERARRVRSALFSDPPAGHALLAWDGPVLAGFAGYQFIWPSSALTTSLYLKELYVTSAYRRAGVGRLLMDRLRAIAVARGCTRLEWTTDTSNGGAQSFYESLGAEPLETKLFYRATL